MTTKPCAGLYAGMSIHESCSTCAHVVAAHTWPGSVCSVCEAVAEIRATRPTEPYPRPATPEPQID